MRPVRLAYKPYFLANEQYFSLTTNQPIVLSVMAYQLNEQNKNLNAFIYTQTFLGVLHQ